MGVDTMEVTMDVRVPVRSTVARVTQPVHEGLENFKTVSHRAILAYVGACAVAYDNLADVVQEGAKLLDAAAARGAGMQEAMVKRLQFMERTASGEIKKVQSQIEESVEQTRSGVVEASHGVTDELEKRVEVVLANLGVPSRERLDRLSREIDELNEKLDLELARTRV